MINSNELPNSSTESETIERVITPQEFLELTLDYLKTDLSSQAHQVKKLAQSNSLLQGSNPEHSEYTEPVLQAVEQLNIDLPIIEATTRNAMAGKPVQIINRPAGSFFYVGELKDQADRPEETIVEKTFTQEQASEVVILFHRTLENRSRQDVSTIAGYSELLAMFVPNQKASLDIIKTTALGVSKNTTLIEDQAKLVLSGQPIKITKAQGQQKLNLGKVA